MKIVKIIKKPWWWSGFLNVEKWWARVEIEGKIYTFSVWANDYDTNVPIKSSFLWDLKGKIEKKFKIKIGKKDIEIHEQELYSLQGKEFEICSPPVPKDTKEIKK
mgnify:CR=1 FL=1